MKYYSRIYVRTLSKLDSELYLGGVLFESRMEIFELFAIFEGFPCIFPCLQAISGISA
jgi:hypothetical protein